MRRAIVSGIHGQDGTYMARLLSGAGYDVVGLAHESREARESPVPGIEMHNWDMSDQRRLADILRKVQPTCFFNFAALSSGAGMFDEPVAIADINGVAVARILEAIQQVDPLIRFCQASSSEMFGTPAHSPQNEMTPFAPRTPYGAAKLYAHWMIDVYRKRYGLFACSAILFNHESPLRGTHFVTRKVTLAAARIKLGLADELRLGNLDARRDWGYAGDYVEAMRSMLEAQAPQDYVIATGQTHSVRQLCELAFGHVGLDYGDYVRADSASFRANEEQQLVGDSSKASRELHWKPRVSFAELVAMMVDADMERLSKTDQIGNIEVRRVI